MSLRAAALAAMLAACRSPAAPPQTRVIVQPSKPCPEPEPRRAPSPLLAELADLDRQLDLIDTALVHAAHAVDRTRDEALQYIASRTTAVLVTWIEREHLAVAERVAELARVLGPKHAELVEAKAWRAIVAGELDGQRGIERLYLDTWRRELETLPVRATAKQVRDARSRALLTTYAQGVPSDAPPLLVVARLDLVHARLGRRRLEGVFGPKHPDMIDAVAAESRAEAALRAAITEASAAPDATALDRALIERRAELARRAFVIRRELPR